VALDLTAYRQAVADLERELRALADPASATARQVLLDVRLREPAIAEVLAATPQGIVAARETLLLELAHRQHADAPACRKLTALVRSYLLTRIDLAWWGRVPALATSAQVEASQDLVDLEWLRRRELLDFRYREQPGGPLRRGLRAVRAGLRPGAAPATAGLPHRRTRRELVALLNDLAREFAGRVPAGSPPLWVESLVLSVADQHRLRRRGRAGPGPGAHCLGYAVDLPVGWYRRSGTRDRLTRILLDRQEAGELNVVDEGEIWHLCLAPAARLRLRRSYEAELGA
jgi:hypothetical protein